MTTKPNLVKCAAMTSRGNWMWSTVPSVIFTAAIAITTAQISYRPPISVCGGSNFTTCALLPTANVTTLVQSLPQCASNCMNDQKCIGFNYIIGASNDIFVFSSSSYVSCQLLYAPPTRYGNVTGCQFYQVHQRFISALLLFGTSN